MSTIPSSPNTRSHYMALSANHLGAEGRALRSKSTESEKDQSAAYFRSAISRAYYAAYHHALEYAKAQEPPFKEGNGSTHSNLPAWLTKHARETKDRAKMTCGADLIKCRSLRHAADYRLALSYQEPNGREDQNMPETTPFDGYMTVANMASSIIKRLT